MKKFVLSILLVISATVSYAISNDSVNAVTMVSYEQSWLDSEGTLALKNNTDEPIRNVSFVITYQDMNGTDMDYKEFAYDVDIEPGMTKKIDIPAYEHSRFYHYYKTKDTSGNPSFKIKYKLKGYNLSKEEISESNHDGGDADEGLFRVSAPLLVLFILGIAIGLYVLVAVMAKKRHRNVVLWLLLSFLATPLLIAIILLCIGNSDTYSFDEY